MISKKVFSFITVTALTLFTLLSLNPHIAEGGIVDNTDAVFAGDNWRIKTKVPDYYGENYHIAGTATGGNGANTATWEADLTDGTGPYNVFVWYPKSDALATNALFTVNSESEKYPVNIDQSIYGGQWVSLGTYFFADNGTENVTLSDKANSWVIADAVKFEYAHYSIVDNTNAVFVGDWKPNTKGNKFPFWGTDLRWRAGRGTGANTATWNAELTGPAYYKVLVWYVARDNYATNAPFTITYKGGVDTVLVNQTQNGGQWVSLGTYLFAADGTENVTLSDDADAFVIADAVRFVLIDGIVDNGDPGFSVGGEWTSATKLLDYYGDDYLWAGNKSGGTGATATWDVELTDGPGFYKVSVRYPTGSKLATNAQYTINYYKGEYDTTVEVDQTENGGNWVSLGTYAFADDGTENVILSDKANKWVVADAVEFVRVGPPDKTPPVITDVGYGDVKYTSITISWNTDELSDSVVKYGTVEGGPYTYESKLVDMVTSHEISLENLTYGTTYYFIIESTDMYNNTGRSQDEYSFNTKGLSLGWTDTDDFTNGVNDCKWSCGNPCTVEFRVKYFNELNDSPTKNEIWIDMDNDGYKAFDMVPGDGDYTDGMIYTYTRDGRDFKGTIKYRFSFSKDEFIATGEPTANHEYVNDIEDFDEDGIDDFEEGDGDIDGDGRLDCEDDDTTVLSVNGGKSVALDISNSSATLSGVRALSDDASVPAGKPNVNFDFGLVGFTINGVSPGGSVPVTITYSESIPDNAEYWKFNNNGQWYSIDFSRSADNKTITLTLTDGGEGDSDNEANGTIVDPGGIGTPSSNNAGAGAISEDGLPDSAGGCFIGAAARR